MFRAVVLTPRPVHPACRCLPTRHTPRPFSCPLTGAGEPEPVRRASERSERQSAEVGHSSRPNRRLEVVESCALRKES